MLLLLLLLRILMYYSQLKVVEPGVYCCGSGQCGSRARL